MGREGNEPNTAGKLDFQMLVILSEIEPMVRKNRDTPRPTLQIGGGAPFAFLWVFSEVRYADSDRFKQTSAISQVSFWGLEWD